VTTIPITAGMRILSILNDPENRPATKPVSAFVNALRPIGAADRKSTATRDETNGRTRYGTIHK
jgi:hypothetical protein